MNKTLLVAQREFVENMRTKTFWIGILSFPILIGLFIVGQRVLQGSKDDRPYTILDQSEGQWLSEAIRERAATSDVERALGTLMQELEKLGKDERLQSDQDALVAELRKLPRTLAKNDVQEEAFDRIVKAVESSLQAAAEGTDIASAGREAAGSLLAWFGGLSEAQRADLHSNLDTSTYQEVEVDTSGDDDPRQILNDKLNQGELFAYFVINEDPVATNQGCDYVSQNLTDNDLRNWFESHATQIVRTKRIEKLELTEEQARSLRDRFSFKEQTVTETGESEEVDDQQKAASFAPVAFVYLLWIAVFTAAQMLLTNTVEEKSNRLIEVLLSSVSPIQLMAGKVIGIAATGLTIVVSWVISAVVGVQFIPGGALGSLNLVAIIGDPLYLGSFVAYFLAGYLLYAAVLVALGSMCDSLKEAQNLMQPVFIILIVPLVAMMFVVQDPNGTAARVLTYIPLFTAFLMMNRAGGPPPAWEYAASTVVIIISLIIAFWGAAKIFRVGILMTGKPPKIGEILRWLRAPVGTPLQRVTEATDASTK